MLIDCRVLKSIRVFKCCDGNAMKSVLDAYLEPSRASKTGAILQKWSKAISY